MTERHIFLRELSKSTAQIVSQGKVIGHIGLMSGGTCAFVNAAKVLGVSFVAHSTTCEAALAELVRVLDKQEAV